MPIHMTPRQCKLVLLGDTSVGKTSLVQRLTKNSHNEDQESTIGVAFQALLTEDKDHGVIRYEIWDTAGQERYRSLASLYYRNTDIAMITYDITNMTTLDSARQWIRDLRSHGQESTVCILVGNKLDRETERDVPLEAGQAFAQSHGMRHIEVSARSGIGIPEFMTLLAESLPQTLEGLQSESECFPTAPPANYSSCC